MTGHKNAAAQDSRIEQGQDASQVAPEPVAAVPAPRTDAFHDKWDSYNYPHEAIHFARQLETELHLVTQQHDATIDVLKQTRTELAAAKAERERTLQANYVIREQQKEDFARAEKAEAALAEANRKLAEFEQYALNYLWIINDNCGENTADDAVSAVELLLNTDMTSEQLHAAITSARKGESVWN